MTHEKIQKPIFVVGILQEKQNDLFCKYPNKHKPNIFLILQKNKYQYVSKFKKT